jgi:hypothetical protein
VPPDPLDALAPPELEPEPEPALDEPPDEATPEEDPPDVEALAVVLVVEVVLEVVGTAEALAAVAVGTVNGGAAEVSVEDDPPPQAASATETATPPASATSFLVRTNVRAISRERSGTQRFHSPAAVGAVVQVLLAQLIAPVAEPEVLHRPGEL